MAESHVPLKSIRRKPLPPLVRVNELLRYEPDTGLFFWKVDVSEKLVAGGLALRKTGNGYRSVCIDGESYSAHRLAFLIMTGSCPDVVDHRNRNRADNRWDNLREATHKQNIANSSKRTRQKGVTWDSKRRVWKTAIRVDGKAHNLGTFANPDLAIAAYRAAAEQFHGEYAAHLNGTDGFERISDLGDRMAEKANARSRPKFTADQLAPPAKRRKKRIPWYW